MTATTANIGDQITYRALDGERRRVEIVAIDDEKDGRPVFDGQLLAPTKDGMQAGDFVWGYIADIIHCRHGNNPETCRYQSCIRA